MRRRLLGSTLVLIVSAAARSAEPVDAGAEADVAGEWNGHAVAEVAASATIDPADACEAASQSQPSLSTRPAVHTVAETHGPTVAREEHAHTAEHDEPAQHVAPAEHVTHVANVEHVDPIAEPPPRSLAARQGLLLPAAFLAAASALSSLLVYAIRGRSVASRPSSAARDNVAHASEPAAH